jgi:hypothetical protein
MKLIFFSFWFSSNRIPILLEKNFDQTNNIKRQSSNSPGSLNFDFNIAGEQSWLECAKWLDDCGVLTEQLQEQLRKNSLTLRNFAYGLRDGIILCNLLNALSPASIDFSQIAYRAQSRHACIKNIQYFLVLCKTKFNITEENLFQADMLYDLNIEHAIRALSKISKLPWIEQKSGRSGFNMSSSQTEIEEYYNIRLIEENESNNDDVEYHYAGGNFDYDGQVHVSRQDLITLEIFESEAFFEKTLKVILYDFMKNLIPIIRDSDKKIILSNIESLKGLHSNMLKKLHETVICIDDRTSRLCAVYDSFKQKLKTEYAIYLSGMEDAIIKINTLSSENETFKNKLEECRKKFSTSQLSDLIQIPLERALKYHLLFDDLYINTNENDPAKRDIERTYKNMAEIASYLDKLRHNREMLYAIKNEQILKSVEVYMPQEAILNGKEEDTVVINKEKNFILKLSNRDMVTREIYESERHFVEKMQCIVKDFIKPLASILDNDNFSILFINFDILKEIHVRLLEKLYEGITGGEGRTSRICGVYDMFKHHLIKFYVDYFGGLKKSILKFKNLNLNNIEFKNKLNECRKKSELGIFELVDLIRLPYQRVLKYHLLFSELNKNTSEHHRAKKDIEQTYESMLELAYYLNQAQNDKEVLDHINDFNNYFQDCNLNLNDFGHLIKDDHVRIKEIGETFAKTRSLLLFDKAILIYKSKNENYYNKGTILFKEYKLDESISSEMSNKVNSNSLHLNLVPINNRSKSYSLTFKDNKQRNEWKISISEAIDKSIPYGYNSNGHNFEYFNFEREIVYCSLCQKVLLGIFYQGFKCSKCQHTAHRSCIAKFQQCIANNCRTRNNSSKSVQLRQTSLKNSHYMRTTSKFVAYRVRALYAYQGNPQPPDKSCQALKFKENDIIQLIDDDDNEWWKGFKVDKNPTIEEGWFPKSHVKFIKENSNFSSSLIAVEDKSNLIKNESWYYACNRETAEEILNKIPAIIIGKLTPFLVRPSDQGGFAISLRYQKIRHVRIHVLKHVTHTGRETEIFYLDDKINFVTVQDLIAYYSETNLDDQNPKLNTKLHISFNDALLIKETIALNDYYPSSEYAGTHISLVKNNKYWVLNKENNDWWKVLNSNGICGFAPGNYLRNV